MIPETIIELIIGAILTGLLVPYVTGLWQIQKEEISIKRELLSEVTELAFSFILDMQFVAVYQIAASNRRGDKVELETEIKKRFNKMNETYWTWEVKQAQIRTKLTLFGGQEIANSWDQLNKEIVNVYASFESAPNFDKKRLTDLVNSVQEQILKSKIRILRPRFFY